MGIITKENVGGRKMKVEARKRTNLISAKALQKYHKNNKRNNTNSTSCNDCSIIDISRNNNKLSI